MTFDGGASDDGVAQSRILAELEAIFQTPEFERAPVMRRLLAFLVRTTLAGRGDELKAYTVAVDGLGRDPDFDSQSDSYPRVQVGRLRKMLDAHYAQVPPGDGVRIFIKPGGYRVKFTKADTEPPPRWQGNGKSADASVEAPSPEIASKPQRRIGGLAGLTASILLIVGVTVFGTVWWLTAQASARPTPILEIRPVAGVGGPEATTLARRIEALLGIAMHRSWIVRITTPRTTDPADTPAQPDYRLVSQVNAGEGYHGPRVYLTLWDVREGSQIWSDSALLPEDDSAIGDTMRPLISSLIRPFGAIATDQRARRGAGEHSTYACLLDYDRYFRDHEPELRNHVRTCIAEAVKREPRNAAALAAASFLEFDWSIGGGTPQAHARGAELARRAVEADPYSAEAQVADARAAFVSGQCRRGKEIADRAVRLNPYNPDSLGLMGFLLFQCGDPDAARLLEVARTLDNDLPPFLSVAQLLVLIENGNKEEAIRIADTIRRPGQGMAGQYELVRTIAEAANGNIAAARQHWARIVKARKMPASDPNAILSQYFYSPKFRAKVLGYLNRTGVTG